MFKKPQEQKVTKALLESQHQKLAVLQFLPKVKKDIKKFFKQNKMQSFFKYIGTLGDLPIALFSDWTDEEFQRICDDYYLKHNIKYHALLVTLELLQSKKKKDYFEQLLLFVYSAFFPDDNRFRYYDNFMNIANNFDNYKGRMNSAIGKKVFMFY